MDRDLFKPTEVAEKLGLGRSKTYDMIRQGTIPSVRIGGNVRVPATLLKEWLERQIEEGREINPVASRPVCSEKLG